MKALMFAFVSLCLASASAYAKGSSDRTENSKKIKEAVYGMSALAQSGVEEHKIKPTSDVKEALLDLALSTGYIEKEEEFNWSTNGDQWGADSMEWGPADMSEAYSYIMSREESDMDWLKEEGNEQKLAKYKADLAKGKEAFKGLLNTGVKFGVAPMGAVQCGVTFAALAIIDPAGTVYIFASEGSGC